MSGDVTILYLILNNVLYPLQAKYLLHANSYFLFAPVPVVTVFLRYCILGKADHSQI